MLKFIIHRLLLAIPTLFAISVAIFLLIQLPPGSYLETVMSEMVESGQEVDEAYLAALEKRYALDKPLPVQYFKWISNIVLRGDFGRSWMFERPVGDLLKERLPWTIAIAIGTLVFIWIVSFPIGVYSATHQYSIADYSFTFLGFLGLGIPNFMLALILMWIGFSVFDVEIGGLFSHEFQRAPWSFAKFRDLLSHLWVPLVVLGTAGTAGLIRTMRANLLDELNKPYVETARAKGLKENRLIWKYPVRVALNPFISSLAYVLPTLISGSAIISIVLNLPTVGPLQVRALMSQDMYLAGDILLLQSSLTVLGTLLSDIILAWVDPRIRYE